MSFLGVSVFSRVKGEYPPWGEEKWVPAQFSHHKNLQLFGLRGD